MINYDDNGDDGGVTARAYIAMASWEKIDSPAT